MKPRSLFFFLLLSAVTSLVASLPIQSATEIPDQANGSPSQGYLKNPTPLPETGSGFVSIFFPRNRHYGTQGLIEIIEKISHEIAVLYPDGERYQVGDISAPNGGFISGHASHQIGIDYDAVYFRRNHLEQDPSFQKGFQEFFVVNGRVTKNFDTERNWELFKLLAQTGRINRIFMDPAIKKALCKYARRTEKSQEEAAAVLHHLRPYPEHADHMHVRITCPQESPNCIEQEAVPPGDGCNF